MATTDSPQAIEPASRFEMKRAAAVFASLRYDIVTGGGPD
jgi:hypothetical protein